MSEPDLADDLADEQRVQFVTDQVAAIIKAAIARDTGGILAGLAAVNDRYGARAVYQAMCGVAHVACQYLFPGRRQGDGTLTDMLALQIPDGAADVPGQLWACQFITAFANGDADTSTALFLAALRAGEEAFLDRVIELIAIAGDLCREHQPEGIAE